MTLADGGEDYVMAEIGAACSVTEAEPGVGVIGSGNTNTTVIAPADFTVTGDQEIRIVNRITRGIVPKSKLTVIKRVTGAKAAGHKLSNVFNITVDCVTTPLASIELKDEQSAIVEGEVGQMCTIDEPEVPDANQGYWYISSISPKTTLLTAAGRAVTVTNKVGTTPPWMFRDVTLTNAVLVTKSDQGYDVNGMFTLVMNCGAGGMETSVMRVGETSLYKVPLGSECTMNTTGRPNPDPGYKWDTTTYNPASPFAVAEDMNEIATHRLLPEEMRTITVKKSVTGGSANGAFTIQVTCGAETTTLSLADGEEDSVQARDGTECAVTEDDPAESIIGIGNSNTALIVPSKFVVGKDQTVEVINRIETGVTIDKAMLTVTKIVTGEPEGHVEGTLFDIEVNCVTTTPASFKLEDGQSASVEGEVGQPCVTDELTLPAAAEGYYYAPSIVPWSIPQLLVTGANVTVENMVFPDTVQTHPVTVTNALFGNRAALADQTTHPQFTVTLNCEGGYVWTSTMIEGAFAKYSVPSDANCSLTTSVRPALRDTHYWDVNKPSDPVSPFFVSAPVDAIAVHEIKERAVPGIPIPALDLRALLLLMGLLTGLVFWQSRQRPPSRDKAN
jgi:hypothetical protein